MIIAKRILLILILRKNWLVNKMYNAIDLFSGAGGLHLGLEIDWPQVQSSMAYFQNLV